MWFSVASLKVVNTANNSMYIPTLIQGFACLLIDRPTVHSLFSGFDVECFQMSTIYIVSS